jgi:hypothetical protein
MVSVARVRFPWEPSKVENGVLGVFHEIQVALYGYLETCANMGLRYYLIFYYVGSGSLFSSLRLRSNIDLV